MWINGLQQGLGEAGKLRVELEVDPCRKPSETLQQAFDIWIGANLLCIPVQRQPSGNLWIFPGELARHFPQVPQFEVVETEEPFVHALNLPRSNARFRCPAWC